jgi:hypothetical protein
MFARHLASDEHAAMRIQKVMCVILGYTLRVLNVSRPEIGLGRGLERGVEEAWLAEGLFRVGPRLTCRCRQC